MLLLKYLFLISAAGMFAAAVAILVQDFRRAAELRWRPAAKLAAVAWLPLLIGIGIVIVPSGMAGVAISQLSGVEAGTLYPAFTPSSRSSSTSSYTTRATASSPRP